METSNVGLLYPEKNTIFSITESVLLQSKKFVSEKGDLLRNSVIESAQKNDAELLLVLLRNEETKKAYFTEVDDIQIFDKVKFSWIIQNKEFLPDSYTRYKNKIGLTNSRGEFISASNDVELVFPYKDCILEGGQTKEDQKNNEIFYNETLAPDQVSNLLAPKAFCNAKKYDKDGVHEITEITDEDNLIIKGNNLLALSSLNNKYCGKISLIYIDPPYNTGNDSFNYNDKFSHSTWLSFMKGRLEIAKKLLKDDGCIYVQMDVKEAHYLKIIMDEVFERENFRSEIIWDTSIPYVAGNKWLSPNWVYSHSAIFYYAKNIEKHREVFNKLYFEVKQPSGEISKKPYKDVWCDIENFAGFLGAKDIKVNFNSRKPEKLIERIIKSSTKENDIVLDFHLGSGTTAAVAHKMNRRYIGIEQMDYIEPVACERLKKVIAGEQGGISKSQNWQGGGSFIYCELAKLNQNFVDKIQTCKTDEEIKLLTDEILKSDFVSSKVKPSDINTSTKEYSELSFEEKQQLAMALLDKNQLYVNFSERKDPDMKLSANDIKFTESFYGAKK